MSRSEYRPNNRRSRAMLQAIDAGVLAGAEAMANAVLEYWIANAAFPGYTSGDFAKGNAANIEITPVYTKRGKRQADVYSAANRDGEPYPAYWEFGHDNKITGNYEKFEIWRPALEQYADQVGGVMARQIGKFAKKSTQRTGGIKVSES